jgi:hypothetical protein
MNNKHQGAIKSIDWCQEFLKAVFSATVGLILNELIKRTTRRLLGNKRPILNLAGVGYVSWIVFGFLIWLAGTYQTVRGPYSISIIASYIITSFGLLFASGISGLGLNRLANRIDPSHWTARMTKDLETRKKQPKQIKTVPSYIQAATVDLNRRVARKKRLTSHPGPQLSV